MQKKVLVVDDNYEIRILLQVLLSRMGLEIDFAENGKLALEYLSSTQKLPHVIILDLLMPEMDGYKFRELQIQDPRLAHIPVIVMTANQLAENHTNLMATDFLRKPVSIEELLASVQRVTESVSAS